MTVTDLDWPATGKTNRRTAGSLSPAGSGPCKIRMPVAACPAGSGSDGRSHSTVVIFTGDWLRSFLPKSGPTWEYRYAYSEVVDPADGSANTSGWPTGEGRVVRLSTT